MLLLSTIIGYSSSQDTYAFRYNTGNEGPAQIWREERRQADGTIVGRYGYVDPNGEQRVVQYTASKEGGFQARGDTGPDAAAMRHARSQEAEHQRNVAVAMRDWIRAAQRSPVQANWNNQPVANNWNSQPAAPVARVSAPNWNTQPAAPRSFPATSQLAMWNSAWANNNWNLNNQRNTFPEWNSNNNNVRPARTSWNSDSSNVDNSGSWNSQRVRSPANIQRRNGGNDQDVSSTPVASNFDWPENDSADSAGNSDSNDNSNSNNGGNRFNDDSVRTSSSPFHYSFEINHADGRSTSYNSMN